MDQVTVAMAAAAVALSIAGVARATPTTAAATVDNLALGKCMSLESGATMVTNAIDPQAVGAPAGPDAAKLRLEPSALQIPTTDGRVYFQVVGPRCEVHAEGVDLEVIEAGLVKALKGQDVRKAGAPPAGWPSDVRATSLFIGDLGLPRIPAITMTHSANTQDVTVSVSMNRQINVTTDSAPGWMGRARSWLRSWTAPVPDDAQDEAVVDAFHHYFDARDSGRVADAYAMEASDLRAQLSLAEYQAQVVKFNTEVGQVISRRIVRVTWTKDPADAPHPGVYAAIDFVGGFQNADRYCGYLILYQAPTGGDFVVMRDQVSLIDNTTAQKIVKDESREKLDALWAQLSASCPNFPRS